MTRLHPCRGRHTCARMKPLLDHQQVLTALESRYATKQFDAQRKISDADWAVLEKSLVLAPSSFGIQPWKFLVIDTPELREKLKAVTWGQGQVTDAARYVVLLVRKGIDEAWIDRYLVRTAEVRGTTVEALAPFKKAIMGTVNAYTANGKLDGWSSRQVYIAFGQFMTTAAVLGIDTCPIEGLDPAKYDEILGLAGTGYATLGAVAAGYRSVNDKYATTPKVRFPLAEVIEHR